MIGIILKATWTLSIVIFSFLAQTTSSAGGGIDPLTALTQIGIGALIAAPFIYSWRDEKNQNKELRLEIKTLQSAALAREQLLSSTSLQRLVDAVGTLRETQQALSHVAAIAPPAAPPSNSAVEQALLRIESDIRNMGGNKS